jgi:hypothetical protein
VGNVERALKAGFDEVICVGVNGFVEEKIKKAVTSKGIRDERVRVVGVRNF